MSTQTYEDDGFGQWRMFLRSPGSYVHPQHLARCFDGAVDPRLCAALQAEPRFHERLSAALAAKGFVPSDGGAELDCSDEDRAIVMLDLAELSAMARRAGAIWWAEALANVVLAKDVETLRQQLDPDLIAFGLAHRAASPAGRFFADLSLAGEEVERDGGHCFRAWLAQLPTGVAVRLHLRFEDGTLLSAPVPEEFVDIGPQLFRRAAGIS